jgi:hypothetical protein
MESAFDAFDVYAGYHITISAVRNDRGAWVARLKVNHDGEPLLDAWPETVQPEWRTSAEAVRDGIERARRVIRQRYLAAEEPSTLAVRERTQTWFSGEMAHRAGVTFIRGS